MEGRDHPQQASSRQAAMPMSATEKHILIGAAAVTVLGVLLGRRRRSRNRDRSKTGTAAAVVPPAVQAPPPRHSFLQPDARLMHDLLPVLTSALSMLASWRAKRQQQDAQEHARKAVTLATEIEAKAAQLPAKQDKLLDADVVRIMPGNRVQVAWQLCRAAVNAWLDDFAPSMGAAIAYYTAFSIAPVLIIAIAIAGMIFGKDAAQGEIVWQIRSIVGEEGAIAVQGLLRSVSVSSDSVIATTLSVITLVIGSTAVFAELQNALDRIWRTPAVVRSNGVWLLIRTRLLSFGLILGLGFMLMVSLVVSAALAALSKWWGGWIEGWEIFMQVLNLLISFGVFTALFSAIYKFMPRANLSWHDVRIGAVATTVLFLIGKSLIGLYLGRTGMSSGFGAVGSFALLLAWIYYSSQIFLLGAEFTWIYANNFGSRAKRQTRAEKAQEA
ncbi:YihY/virulence factor BrkB family protein [Herbaspirillum rhizosphaerae]|uniref:YihY/virulence factor BrkB family protein n=1 Tax=Herbaspirillum rhizosphaerae TaxID=346179 RepID=UPI000AF2E024|nr:YihY/virulence factor BrkB family protein [Herbaspirillum rhizosphaerae]